MIIPQFRLEQDSQHLILIIRVPYVKITKSEFYIDKFEFKFFLQPYLLNLKFENELKQAEEPSQLKYDYNTYELTVKLMKNNQGEHFDNLDMITKLLNNKKEKIDHKRLQKKKPLIEVLGEEFGSLDIQDNKQELEEQKQIQSEVNPTITMLRSQDYSYGFNDNIVNFFEDLQEEILEIGELNPDNVKKSDRIQIRDEIQRQKFDADTYLYDLLENEDLPQKQQLKIKFIEECILASKTNPQDSKQRFNEEEWNCLIKLPKKQYILKNKQICLNQIIDIAFSFLYEMRMMDNEMSCESAFTINQMSSLLTCFIIDDNLQAQITTCYRRSIIYPLIRNFDLCILVQKDLANLFSTGRIGPLKLCLRLYNLFKKSEPRYLLNILYIEDFSICIQYLEDADFIQLSKQIESITVKKKDLNFDLDEIESEAREFIEQQQKSDNEESEIQIENSQHILNE